MEMEGPFEKATRVRLVFKGGLLNKSQRSVGLRRCWLRLNSSIATISDLSLHILRSFNLENICPNGVTLSVEGFVLPFFESICILRDSDIIRVSRKDYLSVEIVKGQNEIKNIEDTHILQRQPLLSGVKLLAYDKFEKEAGGYQSEYESESEHDGNALHSEKPVLDLTAKKRKLSNADQGSRKKKARTRTTEKADKNENRVDEEKNNELCSGQDISVKQISSVGKSDNKNGQGMKVHPPKKTTSEGTERHEKPLNDEGDVSDGGRKLPSRSARRKKAKRLWLRKMASAKPVEPTKDNSSEKDVEMKFLEREHDQQDDVDDDEVVPVIVEPGHIRFEPISGVDAKQDNGRHEDPVELIKWNGTTCKRKGQKWGKEKTSVEKVNAKVDEEEDLMFEKEEVADKHVDFEQLAPLTGIPEENDIIAYRLIELSSSWCPELSPFRVGKVSSYNPESSVVTLVPVPGYPVSVHHNQEETPDEYSVDASLYKEDGSLEIEFRSLVDARILYHEKGNKLPICAAGEMNGVGIPSSIQKRDLVTKISGDEQNQTMIQEKGQTSWDEISQALNEKKAELWKQVENGKKKEKTAKSSWSYKALRGSALGPTIAYLRAENRI
ncbi:coilin isoform X2 [Nymphaea colorata]|uniref:coilin isoform X2 n=1 Tax=Nymphaea colorata TaxID=210225 RepID=UPI00129E567E|nr:coilin isoform X2 [Nymphaea colorata]